MSDAIHNRQMIEDIKYRLKRGEITLEEAKRRAQPVINEMNEKGKKIAKEFGKRHNPLTFTYLMR